MDENNDDLPLIIVEDLNSTEEPRVDSEMDLPVEDGQAVGEEAAV